MIRTGRLHGAQLFYVLLRHFPDGSRQFTRTVDIPRLQAVQGDARRYESSQRREAPAQPGSRVDTEEGWSAPVRPDGKKRTKGFVYLGKTEPICESCDAGCFHQHSKGDIDAHDRTNPTHQLDRQK